MKLSTQNANIRGDNMEYTINPELLKALPSVKNTNIEAIQFKRDNFAELQKFTGGKARDLRIEKRLDGKCTCRIESAGLELISYEGEYILKKGENEFFRMGRAMFEEIYIIAKK